MDNPGNRIVVGPPSIAGTGGTEGWPVRMGWGVFSNAGKIRHAALVTHKKNTAGNGSFLRIPLNFLQHFLKRLVEIRDPAHLVA